jgi:hypothetical protein
MYILQKKTVLPSIKLDHLASLSDHIGLYSMLIINFPNSSLDILLMIIVEGFW